MSTDETRDGQAALRRDLLDAARPARVPLLRFTGAPANVPLLGHELGHAVALARSAAAQPPIARGWPGVVFEVPSLTAEIAAGDAFVAAHPEHAQAIGFVAAQDLAWSAFETLAFCQVELDLYETRAGGTILTADVIRDAFRQRFGELYGPGVAFDDRDALVAMGGWANYSMHSRFYNFQYAVGALVALALHARRREDPGAVRGRTTSRFSPKGRRSSPAAQLERFGLVLGERSAVGGGLRRARAAVRRSLRADALGREDAAQTGQGPLAVGVLERDRALDVVRAHRGDQLAVEGVGLLRRAGEHVVERPVGLGRVPELADAAG